MNNEPNNKSNNEPANEKRANQPTNQSKASLHLPKSSGKNVTISRLCYNKIIFMSVKTLKMY